MGTEENINQDNTNQNNNQPQQDVNVNVDGQTKNGYAFLRELCSFNADFNAREPRPNPITNRVQYIMHQLEANNVNYEVDQFRADGIWNQEMLPTHNKRINLYIFIKGLNEEKTIIFSSHHDVANIESENCQDNSASVCNLIDLSIQLTKEQPACNVLIAFTDGEEIDMKNVTPYNSGANRLAYKVKAGEFGQVVFIYNLELTANGTHYWYSYQNQPNAPINAAANHMRQLHPNSKRVKTPYSDSVPFEMHLLPSVCIGSLIESELQEAQKGVGCRTWMVCHSKSDTFENFAVETDMNAFVLFLRSLI